MPKKNKRTMIHGTHIGLQVHIDRHNSKVQVKSGTNVVLEASSKKGQRTAELPSGWTGSLTWVGDRDIWCKVDLKTPQGKRLKEDYPKGDREKVTTFI